MVVSIVAVALVVLFAGSVVYVYRFRGKTRYASFKEYTRIGWPICAPLNCLLYLFTKRKARRPIIDLGGFSELAPIRENWETIREEVAELHRKGYFELTSSPESKASFDIGFQSFLKYGWSKFYLRWYGQTLRSASELCPRTAEILAGIPTVNGAMFSLLPAGAKLKRHLDPVACSLRYHLGLITPNSDACYINIDGDTYSWRDGEALLFDETYSHFAANDSGAHRLILMCDIERPLHLVGRLVNIPFKALMRLTVVPNLEGDQRGLVNRCMAGLTPYLRRSKELKRTNRALYRTLQYSLIATTIVTGIALLTGTFFLIDFLSSLA